IISLLFCWLPTYNKIIAFKKILKQNSLKKVVFMTTKIINNFNSLNSEDLSIIEGEGVIGCVAGATGISCA
ncbi:MAG: hypothetical protein ACTMH6_07490, partial [Streptococcus thermophilus]